MNFEDEALLSFYENITTLNDHSNVTLVRHIEEDRIYVKKVLSIYDKSLYVSLQKMNAPGIPKIFHIIEDGNSLVVIEEYINSPSLEKYMEENGTMDEDTAIDITKQLCSILGRLHRADPPIIHRDIKPSNVLISQDLAVTLIDFNAAKTFDQNKNKDTVLMGTADYAAPEQYGFSQSDARTDIYGLGTLLNIMLTGQAPRGKLYDRELSKVITKCINMDPEKRYPSVSALSKKLSPSFGVYLPPGFRTHKVWKSILAVLYYAFTLYLSFNMELEGPYTTPQLWAYRIITFLIFLCPVAVFANYGNICGVLPLAARKNPAARYAARLMWTLIFMFALFLIMAVIIP